MWREVPGRLPTEGGAPLSSDEGGRRRTGLKGEKTGGAAQWGSNNKPPQPGMEHPTKGGSSGVAGIPAARTERYEEIL